MKPLYVRKAVQTATSILLLLGSILISTPEASAEQHLAKIADGIYSYLDTRNATPKNSFGANAGIIIGKEGVLVVDTLVSAKEAARFVKDIRSVSDRPIKYVVNTHAHLDHTFGNSEFAKTGAVIVAHQNCRKNLELNGEATLKRAKGYGLTDDDLAGTVIKLPSVTFTDRMEIDLGGLRVVLIYPGPTHTNESILVYVPEKRVLFAGDTLFTGYHPNIGDADLPGWIKTLDYMGSLAAETIIPGHGPVSGKNDLAAMKDYLIAFDAKAKELTASSNDIGFIVSELKKSLPQRPELDFLIGANVQARYLKKGGAE